MKFLSPPGKLDSKLFYNYDYAVLFLTQLSAEQSARYFYAELLDYWYMICYTFLLLIFFQRAELIRKHRWPVFLPAALDFLENTLIIYYLKTTQLTFFHQCLPVMSALKWLIVLFLLGRLLLKFLARFRKA